jgi:hypothetical protein
MKRIISLLLAVYCIFPAFAQTAQPAANDEARIVLTPYVAGNSNVPEYAAQVLNNKLAQIATRHGLGGSTYDPRFVITANLIEVTRDVTPTAPPQVAITLTPTIYIGDLSTGALFASYTLPNVKGVGTNETKAYLSAIKNINVDNANVIKCIEDGKAKIVDYYNSQIDFIIKEAETLASHEKYEEAIAKLIVVPTVCTEAYDKAMASASKIAKTKIDKESAEYLNEATQIWNSTLNLEGAERAAEYLAKIHPLSSSAEKSQALTAQIAKRVKELDQREWDFAVMQEKSAYDAEMAYINAAKEIGVAQAQQPITYETYVVWW